MWGFFKDHKQIFKHLITLSEVEVQEGSGEDGGWGKFVVFLIFFFDFLSYEGIYCAGGHFDPPQGTQG